MRNLIWLCYFLLWVFCQTNQQPDPLAELYSFSLDDSKKTIVMVGPTGAGKSTLGNLLAGHRLIPYYDRNISQHRFKLSDENHPNKSPIGHQLKSATKIPTVIRLSNTNMRDQVIVDVPGIEQNRGISHEIIGSFTLSEMKKEIHETKLLIVVDEESLNGQSNRVIENILSSMHYGNAVGNNVALVVTKATKTDRELRQLLKNKAISMGRRLAHGAALFELIVSSGRYRFSARPTSTDLNESKTAQDKTRGDIWDMLNKMAFLPLPNAGDQPRPFSYRMRRRLASLKEDLQQQVGELIVSFQTKLENLKLSQNSELFKLLNATASSNLKFWYHFANLSKEPSLSNIVQKQLVRFRLLLLHINDDWSSKLQEQFRLALLNTIMHIKDQVEEDARLGWIQRWKRKLL